MTEDPGEPTKSPLDSSDAAHQVAAVTGMSPEAAETFAAFLSGRFAQGLAFPDTA